MLEYEYVCSYMHVIVVHRHVIASSRRERNKPLPGRLRTLWDCFGLRPFWGGFALLAMTNHAILN